MGAYSKNVTSREHCKKNWPNSKNKATYHNHLFKLSQLATDNLKTLVHLMNKSQSTEC